MRSRRRYTGLTSRRGRITSACAEQTSDSLPVRVNDEDHLRVCGADSCLPFWLVRMNGSPPRVRSRLEDLTADFDMDWITSACAEQTTEDYGADWAKTDHLRVCGADVYLDIFGRVLQGSPPRVRSRPLSDRASPSTCRITSACAEQTVTAINRSPGVRDHLRVCGADTCS